MLNSSRSAALALALAAAFGSTAHAQIAVGGGLPGLRGMGGFTGLTGVIPSPIGVPAVAGSPYGLSTVAGNPYLGAGSLASGPYSNGGYSLATTPGLYPGYGGYGYPPYNLDPNAQYLMGLSSLTVATGQYWKDIESARITRQQANQMSYDTARKRIQFEAWYESLKPTTQNLVDAAVRTDLERARKDPPQTEVWSGKSLNDLLNSIRKMGRLSRGPNIGLEDDTLNHVNLASPAMPGSIGMLRDGGKISWPLGLREKMFDDLRDRLARNIETAVSAIKGEGDAGARLLKDINADLKALQEKVNDSQDDLPITQYLEARRFMAQLSAAVRSLSDPKIKNYFNNTWNAKGRTVSELVDNMTRDGLVFAPAAPGDEAAYSALYYALRGFEAGLALAQR